jgi:hypothetical protein
MGARSVDDTGRSRMLRRIPASLLLLQLIGCNVDSTVGFIDGALIAEGSCSEDTATRCNPGACAVTNVFDAPFGATSLAADDEDLFFLSDARTISRRPIDGGPIVELATAESTLMGMVSDATHIYWTELDGDVRGVEKTGGAPFDAGYVFGNPTDLAVDATHIYWIFPEFGQVAMATKPSGEATHISEQRSPAAISTDATHVYWVNAGSGEADGELMRAERGDLTTAELVLENLEAPVALTVSSDAVYWASINAVYRWVKGATATETVATGFSEVKDLGVYGNAVYGVGMDGLWKVATTGGEWQRLERRGMSALAITCSSVFASGWFEAGLVRYGP